MFSLSGLENILKKMKDLYLSKDHYIDFNAYLLSPLNQHVRTIRRPEKKVFV